MKFRWLGQSIYYSQELIKWSVLPFLIIGWIADKIVSLTFVSILFLVIAWYNHWIPDNQIDTIMNNVGSRLIDHIQVLKQK